MDSPPDTRRRPALAAHPRPARSRRRARAAACWRSDVDAGFLLLEDLGADTYLHVIDADNADALFDDAVGAIAEDPGDRGVRRTSGRTTRRCCRASCACSRNGSSAAIWASHSIAATWSSWSWCYRRLIDNALAQPQVFVHRDFMPRNLMPVAGGPAVIDFQGAVHGPHRLRRDQPVQGCIPELAARSASTRWLERYHAARRGRRPAGAGATNASAAMPTGSACSAT